MTHTPTDLKITTDGEIEQAHHGDFATVSHNEYIKQQIMSTVFDGKDPHEGGPLTPNAIEELRADIRDELRANEYVDPPIRVSIATRADTTVTFDIHTQSTSLQL